LEAPGKGWKRGRMGKRRREGKGAGDLLHGFKGDRHPEGSGILVEALAPVPLPLGG